MYILMPGFDQDNASDEEWAMRAGHLKKFRRDEALRPVVTADSGLKVQDGTYNV